MCLAIPGRVTEISRENGLLMGLVDYSGATNRVCLELIPEITIGQYVLVHAGFALVAVDEEEATKTLVLFDELAPLCSDQPEAGLRGSNGEDSNRDEQDGGQ